MKSELKNLYKRDKKLAVKVAKILGYKINAKKTIKAASKEKALNAIYKYLEDVAEDSLGGQKIAPAIKKSIIKKLDRIIDDLVEEIVNYY